MNAPGADDISEWFLGTDSGGRASRRSWRRVLLATVAVVVGTGAFAMRSAGEVTLGSAGAATTAVGTSVLSAPPSTAPTTTVLGGDAGTPPPTIRAFDHVPRIAYFGDSIAVEAEPHVSELLRERRLEYRFDGWGGTATCDYLDEMQATAEAFDPDVVILQFTGNALTKCMLDRTGGGRGILGDDLAFDLFAFAASYDHDTAAAIAAFGPDVDVILLGVLPTRDGLQPPAQIVDDLYRRYAAAGSNVHYLMPDELLAPYGNYVDELPCTFLEPCVPGDLVPVRAEDGGHLCQTESGAFCFGGLRMAWSIVDAVDALLPPTPRLPPPDQ